MWIVRVYVAGVGVPFGLLYREKSVADEVMERIVGREVRETDDFGQVVVIMEEALAKQLVSVEGDLRAQRLLQEFQAKASAGAAAGDGHMVRRAA